MSKRTQRWMTLVLVLVISLFTAATALAEYGPDEGTIRGAIFLDKNRNGVRDEGEEGLGPVYFTISSGDYSHMYHSEWQTTDDAGNTYATGTFGPVPLHKGAWKVTLHVPDGYVATTPVEQTVMVPGKEGGHVAEVYMGLYPSSGGGFLPRTGLTNQYILIGALGVLGVGILVAIGLGIMSRRRS